MLTKIIHHESSNYFDSIVPRIENLKISDFTVIPEEKFSRFTSIYPFTTENLSGYYPLLSLNNKSVLTVAASGDHIINAAVLGSHDICAFEINNFASLYSELKFSALENLSFDEFKKFFFRSASKNGDLLNFDTYNMLRDNISVHAQTFFDTVYEDAEYDGLLLKNSLVFRVQHSDAVKQKSNIYLHSEKNYLNARNSMPESITWINDSLQNLNNLLNKKFDVMIFSNIADYVNQFIGGENPTRLFFKEYIMPLLGNLNDDGVICAAYLYNADVVEDKSRIYHTDIDNPRIRRELLRSLDINYSEIYIDGITPLRRDAILLLHK